MSRTDTPEFHLRLRCPADPTDQDGTRRLRSALKRLWRGYSLRCVECRPVEEDCISTRKAGPESKKTPENAAVSTPDARPEVANVAKNVATGPQNDTLGS